MPKCLVLTLSVLLLDLFGPTHATAQNPQIVAGSFPASGLVQAPDGSIYGTTLEGGGSKKCNQAGSDPYPIGCGTVFRISASGAVTSIYTFSGRDSTEPGPIGVGSDGNLYGMTSGGWNESQPIAFKMTTTGSGFTKISTINGQVPPWASLLSLKGKFYLPNLSGTSIFVFGPGEKVHYLTSIASVGEDGMESGLTLGPDGALYEGIYDNPGCVVRAPFKGSATDLYCNSDFSNGAFSNQMAVGPDGMLYGMTQGGGANGYGVFFSLSLDGIFTDLNDLTSLTGNPAANGLTLGNDDNLYGVTFEGGAYGTNGSLVKATTAGTVTDVFDFGAQENAGLPNFFWPTGLNPSGTLLKAQDGTLWGTTAAGGILVTRNCGQGCKSYYNEGFGTIFQYDPVANKLTVVAWFSGK